MTTQTTSGARIDRVLEQVSELAAPMLSMYLELDPARGDASVRAKSTMRELEVDPRIARRVLEELEQLPGASGTLAVFADAQDTALVTLPTSGPVTDPTTGHAEARWGPPYLTPLLAAAAEDLRCLAAVIERDRAGLFSVGEGGVEELEIVERSPGAGEFDRQQPSKQERPAYQPTRGGAARDDAAAQMREHQRQFHSHVAERIAKWEQTHDGLGLVVLGPERDRAGLERAVAGAARIAVLESMPGPSGGRMHAKELAERVLPVLRSAHESARRELVEELRARGSHGVEASLELMQQGRAGVVAIAASHDGQVYRDRRTGFVAATRERAAGLAPAADGPADGAVEQISLREALGPLALACGAQVVALQGELDAVLEDELGGLAALSR